MDIFEMTKEDFKQIEYCKWDENLDIIFNSIVIIPTGELHDSGWMCMDFIAVDKENNPLFRFGGCSDVLHIDGTGGYGEWKNYVPTSLPIRGWRIDCLPCGYLRLFHNHGIRKSASFSDMQIYGGQKYE